MVKFQQIILNSLKKCFHLASSRNKNPCEIDPHNKSITVHNFRKNCNNTELRLIFTNLKAGTFPNGKYKGYVIQQDKVFDNWNGKTITYLGGHPPNDYGAVYNIVYNTYARFKGTVFRHAAPYDGKEAIVLDYKDDVIVPFMVDYLREVQRNLYLGISTFREYEKNILAFFMLVLP